MAKITKDMTLGEIMQDYPEAIDVMLNYGLHCVGCHIAFTETIEQGAEAHGIDLGKLLKDMNKAVKKS